MYTARDIYYQEYTIKVGRENRPVTRISQEGVLLNLVGDHSSRGLGSQSPDVDNNLIYGVF